MRRLDDVGNIPFDPAKLEIYKKRKKAEKSGNLI